MTHISCMLDKKGHTHAVKYVILIAFPQKQRFANAPQRYVIRTLSVLFYDVMKMVELKRAGWPLYCTLLSVCRNHTDYITLLSEAMRLCVVIILTIVHSCLKPCVCVVIILTIVHSCLCVVIILTIVHSCLCVVIILTIVHSCLVSTLRLRSSELRKRLECLKFIGRFGEP
jgi:hypothetical protein